MKCSDALLHYRALPAANARVFEMRKRGPPTRARANSSIQLRHSGFCSSMGAGSTALSAEGSILCCAHSSSAFNVVRNGSSESLTRTEALRDCPGVSSSLRNRCGMGLGGQHPWSAFVGDRRCGGGRFFFLVFFRDREGDSRGSCDCVLESFLYFQVMGTHHELLVATTSWRCDSSLSPARNETRNPFQDAT